MIWATEVGSDLVSIRVSSVAENEFEDDLATDETRMKHG
jgi:hypothetical protein